MKTNPLLNLGKSETYLPDLSKSLYAEVRNAKSLGNLILILNVIQNILVKKKL